MKPIIGSVAINKLAIFLLLQALALAGMASTLVLEGRYQQRNIFVINGASSDGVGFCVYEVTVNGLVTSDEINSQAFEIDLSIYGLKTGDPLTVVIKHKDGCTPRVLNPGALEPAPSFVCAKIECTPGGNLSWDATGEMGKIPYIIQQFKWNKWVNVGEVMGNGTATKNTYRFQVSMTSGLNKFRVAQKSYEGDLRKSGVCEVTSTTAAVTQKYDKKTKMINFSAETSFELFNIFGQIVKKGRSSSVDCTALIKGEYYISYDNKTDKIFKK